MKKKTLAVSSSGLKNVVLSNEEDDFRFILGKSELKMNRFFADFISPLVSRMHMSDPTINTFDLNNYVLKKNQSIEIFDDQLLENFKQISTGYSVKIDKEQAVKLRILSIILENNEIFDLINNLFPIVKKDIIDIDISLLYLPYIPYFICGFDKSGFDYQSLFDYISSHFYLIDQEKLLKLPKLILYSIISNEKLKLYDEDSLYDFINSIFSKEDSNNERDTHLSKIEFYEFIDFSFLSEGKFLDFIENIESTDITHMIWEKLKECIHHFSIKKKFTSSIKKDSHRYVKSSTKKVKEKLKNIDIIYDNDVKNAFKGIIYYLGNENPKSVIDNNIIDIIASSVVSTGQNNQPQNIVDFDRNDYKFFSKNENNSWICYDFKEKKVKLSHYTIRSTTWSYNVDHLQNWCIEASNDAKQWKILSTVRNEKSLIYPTSFNTFKIEKNSSSSEYFRYIRLRQDGLNTGNDNVLGLAAFELFGSILKS